MLWKIIFSIKNEKHKKTAFMFYSSYSIDYLCSNLKFKKMKELLEQIGELYSSFNGDAQLQCEKSNKAAGMRARKTSLKIEKLMKEFRKASMEELKK